MKQIFITLTIASTLLLVAGCSNSASTDNQSTNAPTEQQPPAMNTNSPSGEETTNVAPFTGVATNSAGMDANNPATTNNMNTTTNVAPP